LSESGSRKSSDPLLGEVLDGCKLLKQIAGGAHAFPGSGAPGTGRPGDKGLRAAFIKAYS